jgi:ligand-binding sensor domain-containing protein
MAALLTLSLLWGCSKEEETPVSAPLPAWESVYGACRATAIAAKVSTNEVFVGTLRNGLRIYDGSQWVHLLTENSGILSNQIRDLAIDGTGAVWIATDKGVTVMDGSGFTHHTPTSTGTVLPDNDTLCLFRDASDRMWVGTASGAAYCLSGTWTGGFTQGTGLAADRVACIGQETAGSQSLWFGHGNTASGLTRWDGSTYTLFTTADGLSNNNVNGIDFDSSNTGWFATNLGLTSFDGTTWNTYFQADGLPGNFCRDVDVDGNDEVWIATGGGVGRFQPPSGWNSYGTGNGIFNNSIHCILAGHGMTARAGCEFGYNEFDGSAWSGDLLWNAPLSHNTVRDIAIDPGGRVWYATEYGVTRQGFSSTWDAWSTANSALSGNFCPCVYVERVGPLDVAWIGTFDLLFGFGLNRFDGSVWQNYVTGNSGIPGNDIFDIAPDPSGGIWIATGNGVSLFDGGSTFQNFGVADGLAGTLVTCVGADGTGTAWAGTWTGLSRFDGVSSWTSFTTADGLPQDWINDLAFDSGGIWVSTGLGGVAYSSDNGNSWTVHNVVSGALPANDARGIAVAPNGDVYVATAGGLAVRSGTTWRHLTTWNSGLVYDVLDAVAVSPDGSSVFIGTVGAGVSLYRP